MLIVPARRRRSGVTADRRPRPRRPARSGPMARGAEVRPSMKLLDKNTTGDLTKLLIFMVVTTLATGVLVVTIGNSRFAQATTTRRSSPTPPAWSRATTSGSPASRSARQGRRDRRPHPRPGHLQRRRPHPLTEATHATIRYRNLVGQRYIALSQETGAAAAARRRHDPGRPDHAGARPDGAVQRLQAAVPGALPDRRQQARLRDHPGLPGRGRHARGPARAHRLGDQHAGRPRPDHRRAHRQPQRGAGHIGDRDQQLRPADHQFRSSSAGWRTTARRSSARSTRSPPRRADRRPGHGHPPAVRRRHQAAAPASPATSTATAASSTGPCRCCRSSWTRSAAPRSTAPGSTSTSATSRAGQLPGASTVPVNHHRLRPPRPRRCNLG